MQPTDEELFLAVKDDDYLSYNQLFTRFYRRLCLFVFDYTRDESASEDIVQELFLKLWIDRKRINIRETVSSYLYKFAKNAAFNYLRSEKNRQKVMERLPIDEVQPENDGLDYEEFLVYLQVCIGKLPERSKLVFTMNRLEEMKLSEISEKLHVSVKTIKNQLWKSLQYIRSCLQAKEMI
jgi:RNA polymerase sigma-70 factor (ECF subfamily)